MLARGQHGRSKGPPEDDRRAQRSLRREDGGERERRRTCQDRRGKSSGERWVAKCGPKPSASPAATPPRPAVSVGRAPSPAGYNCTRTAHTTESIDRQFQGEKQ